MDDGPSPVTDAEIDAQIRRQARTVYLRSVMAAILLTVIVCAIPVPA